ncbi:MAG: glycerophosphodiester phosphodiesterase family protein, partial [Actinomycetes bacterium]
MPETFAFLEHEGPIAFAHRGGAADGLENSLAAFGRAVELGYRYLETDVHATADGVLLAFHDRTLDRVTDRAGRVADLPWSTVRQARIGGREPIPLLEDLLGGWPDIRVNVDVKHPGAIEPLVEVVRRTGSLDRICVASFSEQRLAAVRRELGPLLCTSLGTRGVALLRAAATHRG